MPHNRQQESPIATPAQWGKHPTAGGVALALALAVAILAGGCKSGGAGDAQPNDRNGGITNLVDPVTERPVQHVQ
jgi:hypothetical protein